MFEWLNEWEDEFLNRISLPLYKKEVIRKYGGKNNE